MITIPISHGAVHQSTHKPRYITTLVSLHFLFLLLALNHMTRLGGVSWGPHIRKQNADRHLKALVQTLTKVGQISFVPV